MKRLLQIIVEKITGKNCENCEYYKGWCCESRSHYKCSTSIFPRGWEKKGGAE